MRKLSLLLLLTACAGARPAGAPAETEVQVVDEAGEVILGNVSFWSRKGVEECSIDNSDSCTISLPTGDYSFTFRKVRAGRVGGSIGGTTGGEKAAGCLRARVHVVPGTKIVCKKRAEFNCAKGAYETMDCGNSAAVRYGYKPKPAGEDDSPPDK
jgi:hypothetical protein